MGLQSLTFNGHSPGLHVNVEEVLQAVGVAGGVLLHPAHHHLHHIRPCKGGTSLKRNILQLIVGPPKLLILELLALKMHGICYIKNLKILKNSRIIYQCVRPGQIRKKIAYHTAGKQRTVLLLPVCVLGGEPGNRIIESWFLQQSGRIICRELQRWD